MRGEEDRGEWRGFKGGAVICALACVRRRVCECMCADELLSLQELGGLD